MNTYNLSPEDMQMLEEIGGGALVGVFAFVGIIGLVIGILTIAGQWKILTKAGEAGWKSLIPIYNLVTLFKVVGINPWFVLGYFASAIPVIGGLIPLALSIYFCYKLALAFGKDILYTIGLCIFPYIFMPMLGFGKAEYVGPVAKTENF